MENKYLNKDPFGNWGRWLLIIGLSTTVYIEAVFVLLVSLIVCIRGGHFYISKKVLLIFTVIGISSSILIFLEKYDYDKFIQQFALLFFFYVFYYSIFKNTRSLKEMFFIYIKYTYILAILGVIQFFIFYFTRINIFRLMHGYSESGGIVNDGILRISSIFTEPAQFALFITPAVVYCILILKNEVLSKTKSLFLILVFLGTFSTMSTLIFVLIFAYKYIVVKNNILIKISAICFFISFVIYIIGSVVNIGGEGKGVTKDITLKLSDSFSVFNDFDPEYFETLNLSSYATFTNLWVAINAPNRITGTGLGTHEQNYLSTYKSVYRSYGLNKEEGFAIGNRMFSEFGIIGLLFFISCVYKWHDKYNPINISVFFYIATVFFRGGHYSRYGLVFFFLLYFFSHIKQSINDINQ